MLVSEYREVTTCYSFTSPQRRLPVKVSVRGLFTFYILCRFAYGIHFPIELQKNQYRILEEQSTISFLNSVPVFYCNRKFNCYS